MTSELLPPGVASFRFGLFEVLPRSGELFRKGKVVPLQDQPFRLLCLLLENHGQVITREEVRAALWPGVGHGSFDEGISAAIRKLRLALQDSAKTPRYVETLPKHGFRFIGAVEILESGKGVVNRQAVEPTPPKPVINPAAVLPEHSEPQLTLDSRHFARRSADRWTSIGKKAGLVVGGSAGLLGLWFYLRPAMATLAPARIRALAVLPLVDLNHREDQVYLSEGLTGELITRLAKRPELRVIDLRTALHYRNSSKTSHEIASELGVDGIVEGTLQRSGDQVRVHAQLVAGSTQQTLWAESYTVPMGELLDLQDSLASAIAKSIELKTAPNPHPARSRIPAEAMEAYLRGNYSANLRDTRVAETASAEFEKAISLAPGFAEAHAGLADHYLFRGTFSTGLNKRMVIGQEFLSKARAATDRALALDPNLAQAHCAKAAILLWLDWDWGGAESASKRALVLDPTSSAAHGMHAWSLLIQGHAVEAIQEARRGRELNPLSVDANAVYVAILLFSRSYDEGSTAVDAALKLEPENEFLLSWRSRLLMARGDWRNAVEIEAFLRRNESRKVATLRQAFTMNGERGVLAWLARDGHANGYYMWEAVDLMMLGRKGEALDALEIAHTRRDPALPLIGSIDAFDALRDEQRFQALLRRMKLAQFHIKGQAIGSANT